MLSKIYNPAVHARSPCSRQHMSRPLLGLTVTLWKNNVMRRVIGEGHVIRRDQRPQVNITDLGNNFLP